MGLELNGIKNERTRESARETLRDFTIELRREFGDALLGVIIGGSSVTGGYMRQSDLDLFALTRHTGGQERVNLRKEFEITTFFEQPEAVEKDFSKFDYPWKLRMFANGETLYDPKGYVEKLKNKATTIWAKGRAKAESTALTLARHAPVSALRDAEDILDNGDEATANLILADAFTRLMDSYDAINGLWPDKAKYRLAMLEATDPYLAGQAKKFLTAGLAVREKFNLLSDMTDHVLEPVGGRVYGTEWQTSPKHGVFW